MSANIFWQAIFFDSTPLWLLLPYFIYSMLVSVMYPDLSHFLLPFSLHSVYFLYSFAIELYLTLFTDVFIFQSLLWPIYPPFLLSSNVPPSILYHVNPSGSFKSIIHPWLSDLWFYLPIFSSSSCCLSCLVLSASECRDPYSFFVSIFSSFLSLAVLSPVVLGFLFGSDLSFESVLVQSTSSCSLLFISSLSFCDRPA